MGKIRYVVEPVDVDGDGIPDGDLVKKFDGNKLVSQKFVPKKQLEKLAKKAQKADNAAKKSGVPSPNQKVVYKTAPKGDKKAVVVKDDTNFGHLLKVGVGVGAGAEVGRIAVDAIFDGLADLF